MAKLVTGATVLDRVEAAESDLDPEFTLDLRVIEAGLPVPNLLRSTSDNCGSSCSGSACTSFTSDPA
jgi:FxLD family lantipeptide